LECTQSDDAIHHHHHGAAAAAAAGGRFSVTTRSRAIGRQIFPIFDAPTGGGKARGARAKAMRCGAFQGQIPARRPFKSEMAGERAIEPPLRPPNPI
jgi:hypothetical protein